MTTFLKSTIEFSLRSNQSLRKMKKLFSQPIKLKKAYFYKNQKTYAIKRSKILKVSKKWDRRNKHNWIKIEKKWRTKENKNWIKIQKNTKYLLRESNRGKRGKSYKNKGIWLKQILKIILRKNAESFNQIQSINAKFFQHKIKKIFLMIAKS